MISAVLQSCNRFYNSSVCYVCLFDLNSLRMIRRGTKQVFIYPYCYVLCILIMYVMFCVSCIIVLLCVLFVCKCVLYYCHRVFIQLQLTNIYHIVSYISFIIYYHIYHIILYIYIYIIISYKHVGIRSRLYLKVHLLVSSINY
jgi:hypothetical protein